MLRPVIDPVPAMNRRFFMISKIYNDVQFAPEEKLPGWDVARGNGWGDLRARPPMRMVLGKGESFRRSPALFESRYAGTHILSRSLLEIWQRWDPKALDIRPVAKVA